MANKIQLRRDTTANWNNVNPILADGEPGLDITTNQVKYGDGANAWVDLSYASGGGFTNVEGLVTFPGDLLIGTLWPNDPMPEGDKESVVWAKDDTEYLGLWWGGSQTYPEGGYGPVAGIMIGTGDFNSTDDFTGASPADTNITIGINNSSGDTNTWIFDRDGILTFPDSGLTIGTVAGEVQIGTISTDLNILRSGVDGVEIFENEVGFYAGNNKRVQVVPTGLEIISGNLTFPDSTTQSTAFDITKFGEGFSLTAADKIVTNKLYSTNETQPTQHYRLELDTNGVVVLPDQSIINGSTIRGIYGTGELNYTGITIGPNVAYQEESWMYVDHTGAYIATKYNTDQKLWQFDNTGNLTLPAGGEIKSATGTGNVVVQSNDGATGYKWTFETSGALILPTVSGNEGAEIDFTKAPNSTLSGSSVIVDQYVDQIRFFEGGGTSRGAYIDLKQAAAGVGTLLNNRVSGFVNAGAFVTMDLLKATVTTTSNRGLSLAATTGSFVIYIAGTYAKTSTTGGAMAEVTLTTTPEASIFDWDFGNAGDSSTYIITDTTNNRSYRITLQIGYLYNNNMISIERLI